MGILEVNRGPRTAAMWLLALVVALALASLMTAARVLASDIVATGARVGGDANRTRFVADFSEPVGYTVFVLPDPYRVIIDFPDVRFDFPPDVGKKALGLIEEYRYGEVAPGRSRIVIDTKGPVLIAKSFLVQPKGGQPARVVVDLVKTSAEVFRKSLETDADANAEAIARAAEEAAEPQVIPADETVAPQSEAIPLPRPKPGAGQAEPAAVEQSAAKPRRQRPLIVIDPGHGGIDPGAVGSKKTKEKDVVLAFALSLRDQIRKGGSYDVALTRSEDVFVSLKDRVRFAREKEADLFIALHADTVRGPSARGATIYTLSDKASDNEAAALAEKENRADIIAGINLETESEEVADILIDLVQRESKGHSLLFARKAVAEMKPVTGFTGKPMRSAGFFVLKAPDVPSVLVELGFLTSRRDEENLTSPKWRAAVAQAMARAIDKYFTTQVAASASP